MDTVRLFDYDVSARGCLGDMDTVFDYLQSKDRGRCMSCLNPHSVVKAFSDPLFKKALNDSDILIPDGTGILLAAKLLGLPITEKVAGSDFFRELNIRANRSGGLSCFFLGSSPEVLERIHERMSKEYPNIEVCGVYSPPFKDTFSEADNRDMIRVINRARPDILWVGMTAPKQETWIYLNKHRLDVGFIGAIGAVFDFFAGTKKRSSQFWIALGLEWLPRFLKEPRRLWERNLKSSPIFLFRVFQEMVYRMGEKKS